MRPKRLMTLAGLGVLAIVLAACASKGNSIARPNSNHVLGVTMRDEQFQPNHVATKAGETVTFRFTNKGALLHEAFIGTMAQQQAHEHEMSSPNGSMPTVTSSMPMSSTTSSRPMMRSNDPVVQVKPGRTGELRYTAMKAGTLLIGCHQPGHWAAGMRATIDVS